MMQYFKRRVLNIFEAKVSVIVPVYNTKEYLEECLNSILNQSLQDIEVICVDDGSTDGSLELLKEYASKDPRLVLLEQYENQGPGAARNYALTKATGDYVAFVDSDDYIHNEMLETMYNVANSDNIDVVMCAIKKLSDNPKEKFGECMYAQKIPTAFNKRCFSWIDIEDILFDLRFVCWNKIYKRKFIIENDIEFSEGIFYEDLIFNYKALLRAEKMRFVRKYFYYNRRQRQGATTYIQGNRVIGAITAMNELERFIKENSEYKRLEERFAAFKFKKLTSYLHKNDSVHIGPYFSALKDFTNDPALLENRYLGKSQCKLLNRIHDHELLDFLMLEYWESKTQLAKLKRQRSFIRRKGGKVWRLIKKVLP